MSARYTVTHRTDYGYEDTVTASYGLAFMLPRDVPNRQRVQATVVIEPTPVDQREHFDVYGNRGLYFAVLSDHRRLVVTTTSHVEVASAGFLPDGPRWELVADLLRTGTDPAVVDASEFRLPSRLIELTDDVADYARPSFPPDRPVVLGALDLVHRIHAEFDYEPGVTSVSTKLDEVQEDLLRQLATARGEEKPQARVAAGQPGIFARLRDALSGH